MSGSRTGRARAAGAIALGVAALVSCSPPHPAPTITTPASHHGDEAADADHHGARDPQRRVRTRW